MRCYNLWITSLLLVFVGSSSSKNALSRCARSIHAKTQDFGMRLTQLLISSSPNENFVVSPLSILSSLTLIHLGSDGSTRSQIANILGLPNTNLNQKLQLTIRKIFELDVNLEFKSILGVFADNFLTLNEKFIAIFKKIYDGKIYNIDFTHPSTSTEIINKYIADVSQNFIQTLFQNTLSDKTQILVSSYAHFQAEWELKFKRSSTLKRVFYLTPTSTILVDMMDMIQSHYNPIYFAEIQSLKIRTVRLKFLNPRYSMYIVLPIALQSTLTDFLNNFNSDTIQLILNQTTELFAVSVHLPLISIKWSKIINEEVKKLGIDEIFTVNSNLSGMVDKQASIRTLVHSADFSFNEDGAGVSYSTRDTVVGPLHLRLVKFFFVDRPFFFFIYDHDIETVLLYSAVFNPQSH